MWAGRPVFVRHRTEQEIAVARAVHMDELKDPERDEDRAQPTLSSPHDGKRGEWLVVVGVCSHLHCVPLGQSRGEKRGDFGGWFCPCHGAHYDTSGRIRQGPAPKNLTVPPWSFESKDVIVIGKTETAT